jgi:hypothetical protein
MLACALSSDAPAIPAPLSTTWPALFMNFAKATSETDARLGHETLFIATAESTVCRSPVIDRQQNGAETLGLVGLP